MSDIWYHNCPEMTVNLHIHSDVCPSCEKPSPQFLNNNDALRCAPPSWLKGKSSRCVQWFV